MQMNAFFFDERIPQDGGNSVFYVPKAADVQYAITGLFLLLLVFRVCACVRGLFVCLFVLLAVWMMYLK